jgi:hypothetical protein
MSAADCSQSIADLRQAGAGQFDAVQLHYLETLCQRLAGQPEPVQRILESRLAQAIVTFQTRFASAHSKASQAVDSITQQHSDAAALQCLLDAGDFKQLARSIAALDAPVQESSLAALVRSVTQQRPADASGAVGSAAGSRPELKAVRQFRNTWSRLRADQQVKQALVQAPQNAGPINSHMLVLRSLALMRDISPDYLSRFMAYADSLLCLQQLDTDRLESAKAASGAARKVAKARRAKPQA